MARKPTGKPNGRPKIEWTDVQYKDFEKLCAMHCTLLECCGWFDIDDKTLDQLLHARYGEGFSEVFTRFSAKGKVSIRRSIYVAATSDNPEKYDFRAAKWLSTQHLGMSEKIAQKIEVEERKVVRVDLSWADENTGDRAPDSDAAKDTTAKKV